jgi:hypothetical protein
VAVIEARRVAVGSTGNTTAKVTSLHRLIYGHLASAFGEEAAALYGGANEIALRHIEATAAERGIDCDQRLLPA